MRLASHSAACCNGTWPAAGPSTNMGMCWLSGPSSAPMQSTAERALITTSYVMEAPSGGGSDRVGVHLRAHHRRCVEKSLPLWSPLHPAFQWVSGETSRQRRTREGGRADLHRRAVSVAMPRRILAAGGGQQQTEPVHLRS